MRRTVLALLSLVAVGTWSQPAQAQVPEPLAELIPAWQAAFNAGDGAAVAAMYTEDGVRLPPEGELLEGREAIAAEVGNYAGFSIDLRATGGQLDGSLASEWGTFELNGTDENGEAVKLSGRWMNALKKTADGWKIHRDIWNFGPDGN